MALESINWVSDLVITNPLAADFLTEGDDHIKGIKVALKNSFPAVAGAVSATHTELSLLSGVTGAIRTSTSTPLAGEWVLMSSVDTSVVSAIDFVSGVGSIVISSAYDEWLFVLSHCVPATAASSLRLATSDDGGVSYASCVSNAQSAVMSSGAQTLANHSALAYFPVTGNQATTTALFGNVRINRTFGATLNRMGVLSDFTQETGAKGGMVRGQMDDTGAINAFRLSWSAGNFTSNGNVKLFGRKA